MCVSKRSSVHPANPNDHFLPTFVASQDEQASGSTPWLAAGAAEPNQPHYMHHHHHHHHSYASPSQGQHQPSSHPYPHYHHLHPPPVSREDVLGLQVGLERLLQDRLWPLYFPGGPWDLCCVRQCSLQI